MIYGYIRVSTELQNCANQKYELECFAAKNKIQINEYIEETIILPQVSGGAKKERQK